MTQTTNAHAARRSQGNKVRLAILKAVDASALPLSNHELAAALELDASTIRHHLRAMRDDRLVTWRAGKARTLQLTRRGRATARGEAVTDKKVASPFEVTP